MLTDEEFTSFFTKAFMLIGILVFIGCIHTVCMSLRGRNIVQPAGKSKHLLEKQ